MSRLLTNRRRSVGVLLVGAFLISLVVVLPRQFAGADAQGPTGPPAGTQLCNGGADSALLVSPYPSAPAGAVTVPAGDDSTTAMSSGGYVDLVYDLAPNTTYWFAPGVHTLGASQYGQIAPQSGDTFLGAPGAILSGGGVNLSAFDNPPAGYTDTGVTIEYLTIENFVPGTDAITVNHDAGVGWTIRYNTIENNTGAGVGLGNNDVVTENCLLDNDQYGFSGVLANNTEMSNVTITNNEIGFNDTNGSFDQNAYVASYSVTSGSPNVATVNLATAINMQVGHTIGVGWTGTDCAAANFGWCTDLANTALNGPKTITGVSGGSRCNSAYHYLCTTFQFTYTGALGTSCASACTSTSHPSDGNGAQTSTVASSNIAEGAAGGGKFWKVSGATITGNWVHDNGYAGLWPDTDNTGFNFSGNYINNNWAEGIIYEVSYNFSITDNTLVDNAWGGGPSPSLGGFPDPAIYISESGSATLASGFSNTYSGQSVVANNGFYDNWGGVVIYENSNRFCGDNSDTNSCTLINPATYTQSSCSTNIPNGSTSSTPDYVDGCRWKSQQIAVTGNTFSTTVSDIGSNCTTANFCGFNGLFSEGGTTPGGPVALYNGTSYVPWPSGASYPFASYIVPNNITLHQNNSFAGNTYCATGTSWHFMGFAQGNSETQSQWQAGEPNVVGSGANMPAMDAGSTFSTGTCSTTSTTTTSASTTTSPASTTTSPASTTTSPATTTTTSPATTTTTTSPATTTTTSPAHHHHDLAGHDDHHVPGHHHHDLASHHHHDDVSPTDDDHHDDDTSTSTATSTATATAASAASGASGLRPRGPGRWGVRLPDRAIQRLLRITPRARGLGQRHRGHGALSR